VALGLGLDVKHAFEAVALLVEDIGCFDRRDLRLSSARE
jgi:hypothetical protein